MNLYGDITQLKGIGEKNGALFEKLHIHTLWDLISYFPRAYESYPAMVPLSEASTEGKCAILAMVASVPKLTYAGKYKFVSFMAKDEAGGVFSARFFNMPYLKNTIKPGTHYVFYGNLTLKGTKYQFEQPKLFSLEEYERLRQGLVPIYSTTKGLSSENIRGKVQAAMAEVGEQIPDPFPHWMLEKRGFSSYVDTLATIHNPVDLVEMEGAKKRMAYEEVFYYVLSIKEQEGPAVKTTECNRYLPCADVKRLIEQLPFRLTASQQKAYEEIEAELTGGIICNRLVQGDVGCGKTIVAILSILLCASNGKQAAFMAPTEVLATQHYQLLEEFISKYHLPIHPVLLTGSVPAKAKKQAYDALQMGLCNLAIGTHALLEEGVQFQKLGLVVTDEQHRFGVRQRNVLTSKGEDVHTLVMSATPIPRTLAMILYGGLSISTIPELPSNRLPIKNAVVDVKYRPTAYRFMKEQIDAGRQCYVICPMVESGETEELQNVVDYTEKLKGVYGESVRIATLHGKMKGKVKNEIMEEFAAGNYDILVSTTVIEVGINVPNATVMLIENAERFGLAALHQLRGRVGRGEHQSYCIFLNTTCSEKGKERLDILGHTNNGFEIANADFRMRGPGQMAGTMQSGDTDFAYADIYDDQEIFYQAAEDVEALLARDPDLSHPAHAALKARCHELYPVNYLQTL